MTNLASRFLDRGADFAAEGDYQKAAEEVWRYLRFQPDNREGRRRLADYHYQLAKASPANETVLRCVQFHHHAIGVLGDARLEESRLAELQLLAGEFSEARTSALKLVNDATYGDSARRVAALATFRALVRGDSGLGQPGAGELLGLAWDESVDAEVASALAEVFRNLPEHLSRRQRKDFPREVDRQSRADEIMDRLVETTEDAESFLARADYRTRFALAGADQDLRHAMELQPENTTLKLRLARRLLRPMETEVSQASRLIEAEACIRDLLAREPESAAGLETLGDIFLARNDVEQAVELWQQSLTVSKQSYLGVSVFLKLAETQVNRNEFEAADETMKQLEARMSLSGFRQRVSSRMRAGLEQSLAMMRGLSKARQGQFIEAREFFRRAIDLDMGDRTIAARAWSGLAQCYMQVAAHDVAADCFGRAAQEQPNDADYLASAAQSWMRAGQPGQAIEYYERLTTVDPSSANFLALAYAIQANGTRLDPERSRASLRTALLQAERHSDQAPEEVAWEVRLMRTHFDRDPSSIEKTRSELNALAETMPEDSPRLSELLRRSFAAIGEVNDGSGMGDDPLLAARVLASNGKHGEAIQLLRRAIEQVPESDTFELKLALLAAELLEHENPNKANRQLDDLWQTSAQTNEELQRIVSFAIRADVVSPTMSSWEQALPRIEGNEGYWSLYLQARRDILSATRTNLENEARESLEDAAIKQQRLAKERPLWTRTHSLAGEIAMFSGRAREAIDAFKRSIDLGNRDPMLVLKLIELLYVSSELAEAERLLPLIDDVEATENGFKLKYSVLRDLNQLDRAESLARRVQSAERGATAVGDLALSQVLMAQGQLDEAEKKLQQIVANDTDDRDVARMSLFNLYVRRGERELAAETLEQILNSEASDRSETEQWFLRAQGAMLLGDTAAGDSFDRAAGADDATVAMCVSAAAYFADRGQFEKAIEHARRARRLEERDDTQGRAFPILARALAARGTEQDWMEIQRLRAEFEGDKQGEADADRLHALLFAQKSAATNEERRRNLLQAMGIMRGVRESLAIDQLMVARLHHQLRDIESDPEARNALHEKTVDAYQRVTYAPDATTAHLREVAAFYLGENRLVACESVLARAEEADQTTLGKRSLDTLALRIQLLAKTGKRAAALPILRRFAADAGKDQNMLLALGEICFRAELFHDAEQCFRRVDDDSIHVFSRRVQATYRSGRVAESLALCQSRFESESASPEDRRAVIRILSSILSVPGTTRDDHARAERTIALAESRMSRDPRTLDAIATIRLVQGRRSDALRLYATAVKIDPNDPVLLNNLATALSSDPNARSKAISLLDRAVAILGRETPELLDTRASILLHQDPAQAENIWLMLENERADPRVTLQLADALMRQGKQIESIARLKLAMERGVSKMVLTPTQRKTLKLLIHQHGLTGQSERDPKQETPQA
ncbi:MAG: tetratricopeptide repeat protein [Planctomycetota bacterium]